MASKTKDWRAELTASGCLKHIVQEKLFTDVTFIFPNGNESCTGHKLILSMRSAVFEAMFYGPMSNGDGEVTISDIDKKTFEMVLRYVCTDELGVDGETVLSSNESKPCRAPCKWATQTKRGTNKQKLLGQALKEIKFGLVTPQEFAEHVPETGLLDKDDQLDIYRWIITKNLHGSQVCDKFKSFPRQSQTLPITLNTSNCTEGTTLPNESRFTIQSNQPIRITSIAMKTSSYQLSSVTVSESEEEERPIPLSNINIRVSNTYDFKEAVNVKANTTVTFKFKFQKKKIHTDYGIITKNSSESVLSKL
ncbi:BTB6B-like protein [Mya arenaria]|uniref:BTB6B-like protein n=1 Tax=Mya arenaria TaxID=6604 RepID=A0ABY7ELA4_MYAAR|nr:BTB6B-like protein [Mya arenaria]